MSIDEREPRAIRAMPDGYVEIIRFGWERALGVSRSFPGRGTGHVPSKHAVRATSLSAPRIVRLVAEVATTLGFDEPYEVWQDPSLSPNACIAVAGAPTILQLIGPVARLLSDDAARAMIGHEIGHVLASRSTSASRAEVVDVFHRPGLAARLGLAAELTADRFGFLACQDLEAAVHLELASAHGDDPRALETDAIGYLMQCVREVDERQTRLVTAHGTHPSMAFRLYATRLFSLTDECISLVGGTTTGLKLASVDAALGAMCEAAMCELERPPPPRPGRGTVVPKELEPPRLRDAEDPADVLVSLAWAGGALSTKAAAKAAAVRERAVALVEPKERERVSSARESTLDDDALAQLDRLEREERDARSGHPDVDVEARFRALEEAERRRSRSGG